ncbi:hypothetical protein K2X33_03630, partial [bacterium]|nr:hypothetical protein [bacterium]
TLRIQLVFQNYPLVEKHVRKKVSRVCRSADCTIDEIKEAARAAAEEFFVEHKNSRRRWAAVVAWGTTISFLVGGPILIGQATTDTTIAAFAGGCLVQAIGPVLNNLGGPFQQFYGGHLLAWAAGVIVRPFRYGLEYLDIWRTQIRSPGTHVKGSEIVNAIITNLKSDFQQAFLIASQLDDSKCTHDRFQIAARYIGEAALNIGHLYPYMLGKTEHKVMLRLANSVHNYFTDGLELPVNFKEEVMKVIVAGSPTARKDTVVRTSYETMLADWLDPLGSPLREAEEGADPAAITEEP